MAICVFCVLHYFPNYVCMFFRRVETFTASAFESKKTAELYKQFVGSETQPAAQSQLGRGQLLQFAEWVFEATSAPTSTSTGTSSTQSDSDSTDTTTTAASPTTETKTTDNDVDTTTSPTVDANADADADAETTAPAPATDNTPDPRDFDQARKVIVGGHSIWFRRFFRQFLGKSVEHDCKTYKIQNGGVVGFTLQQLRVTTGDTSVVTYRVVPDSIRNVFLTFDYNPNTAPASTSTSTTAEAATENKTDDKTKKE